jgi:hypothetical protein
LFGLVGWLVGWLVSGLVGVTHPGESFPQSCLVSWEQGNNVAIHRIVKLPDFLEQGLLWKVPLGTLIQETLDGLGHLAPGNKGAPAQKFPAKPSLGQGFPD